VFTGTSILHLIVKTINLSQNKCFKWYYNLTQFSYPARLHIESQLLQVSFILSFVLSITPLFEVILQEYINFEF